MHAAFFVLTFHIEDINGQVSNFEFCILHLCDPCEMICLVNSIFRYLKSRNLPGRLFLSVGYEVLLRELITSLILEQGYPSGYIQPF